MFKRLFILVLPFLLIYSCKKVEQLSPGEFICQVNGETWRGTDPEIDRTQENIIEFTTEDTSYRFTIKLNDNADATYDLTTTGNVATVIDLSNEGFVQYHTHSGGGPNSGTLTISSIIIDDLNKTMNGTFAFKAYKIDGMSLNVENGVFKNVPYLN